MAVPLGNPHQVGDDLEGELGRDLLDEVGPAVLADTVDDRVGGPHHVLLEVADHPGGEPLVDQPPVPGVHRRVHVEHHHPLLGQLLLFHVMEERGRLVGGEVLVVPVHRHAVLVAGDRPETLGESRRIRVPLDRLLPAHQGEPLVGDAVDEAVRVTQVDVGCSHAVSPASPVPRRATGCGRTMSDVETPRRAHSSPPQVSRTRISYHRAAAPPVSSGARRRARRCLSSIGSVGRPG